MINEEDAKEEVIRLKKLVGKMTSWKSYSFKGSDLIGLVEQISDLVEYVYELKAEIKELEKKKVQPRIIYKARR